MIDSGRTIAEVSHDLGLSENLLGRWVADERRRINAAAATGINSSQRLNAPNLGGYANRSPSRSKTSRS